MSVRRQFIKYVSQNVLGMVGISLYILADTFFISEAVGADGITALNLVLPIYSIIFSIGAMLGVGSSIRYAVARNQGRPDADMYFVNALFWGTLVSLVFVILGVKAPDKVMMLFGADANIVRVGESYTRIFMVFAPCFVWNHIFNAFVRNDEAPTVAMAATLSSSLFNIVMGLCVYVSAWHGNGRCSACNSGFAFNRGGSLLHTFVVKEKSCFMAVEKAVCSKTYV